MLTKIELKLMEKYCKELHFNNEGLAVMFAVLPCESKTAGKRGSPGKGKGILNSE